VTPIQHVVVILQENHSFDNVLGKLCDDVAQGKIQHDPCDGATEGKLPDGSPIPLSQASDLVPTVYHSVESQKRAIDGGAMDGFAYIRGCHAHAIPPYRCFSQFDMSQIPNVAALATAFAVSDRTFEFRTTPSWAGHISFVSATLDGFKGDQPQPTEQKGHGNGCDSFDDAEWSATRGGPYTWVPSCVPDAAGNGPYRTSPVQFVPTILDRMQDAGLPWRIYGGSGAGGGTGYSWTICPSFYQCLGSEERNNLVPAKDIIPDAKAGNLPAFSIVTPTSSNSQHNGHSMAIGDNWIGSVVSAIEQGPDWSSTAVFVTWDDCGCFYDHVPPPVKGWGLRLPLIIAGPYVRAGYTDSQQASIASLLAFTEHTFGLAPLNDQDGTAYDYSGAFNFGQAPLKPLVMVTTRIPRWEQTWLAAHPDKENDPT